MLRLGVTVMNSSATMVQILGSTGVLDISASPLWPLLAIDTLRVSISHSRVSVELMGKVFEKIISIHVL